MAYDTKVIIKAIAKIVAKADSLEEAYDDIKEITEAEGVTLPDYADARKKKKS